MQVAAIRKQLLGAGGAAVQVRLPDGAAEGVQLRTKWHAHGATVWAAVEPANPAAIKSAFGEAILTTF
jgi:hypothetical protein